MDVKNSKQEKIIWVIMCWWMLFIAQIIGGFTINYISAMCQSTGLILGGVAILSSIFCVEYCIFTQLWHKAKETFVCTEWGKGIMKKLQPIDQKKSEMEILIDAETKAVNAVDNRTPYLKIVNIVSEHYGIDWMYLVGMKKNVICSFRKERAICMYLIHELSGLEYEEIAEIMGKDDCKQVVKEIYQIEEEIKKNLKIRQECSDIMTKIEESTL